MRQALIVIAAAMLGGFVGSLMALRLAPSRNLATHEIVILDERGYPAATLSSYKGSTVSASCA